MNESDEDIVKRLLYAELWNEAEANRRKQQEMDAHQALEYVRAQAKAQADAEWEHKVLATRGMTGADGRDGKDGKTYSSLVVVSVIVSLVLHLATILYLKGFVL